MQESEKDIYQLWQHYVAGRATPEQVDQLFKLIRNTAHDDDNIRLFQQAIAEQPADVDLSDNARAALWENITRLTGNAVPGAAPVKAPPRVVFMRRWGWAAAILLLIGAGAYLLTGRKAQQPVAGLPAVQTDILPGGDRAVLTLSDGTQIALDSAANGDVAQQGNTKVIKLNNGQLAYDGDGNQGSGQLFNTISTPKGGQFQIILPDGSKVWLNAASSVRFPTTFTGNVRNVEVTGEAYLEIAADANRPFTVIANGAAIKVLGTGFNVNAYPEEPAVKVTLVNGSVLVAAGGTGDAAPAQGWTPLRPGQQALLNDKVTVNNSANIDQVVAWKNGNFHFDDMDLTQVMREVERWYNVTVTYRGQVPQKKYGGEIPRNIPLQQLLDLIQFSDVGMEVSGRQITIFSRTNQ